jgi:ubiquinone/menaquinone biosynthesis C-methylase UbiE
MKSERKRFDESSDHIRHLDRVYGPRHYSLYDKLDQSLNPRGPDMLLDVAGTYLGPQSRILDIGCRDASYLIRLVQAYDCQGVGFDPLDWHVEQARGAVDEAGLRERIQITKGRIEQIEDPDDHFDFIWCRDVLELVEGLEPGLFEAARVLKPDGVMLVYTNFATELFEPREALAINGPLGNVQENFDENFMEATFQRAGLAVDRKDVIGTEWREYEEERTSPVSKNLLRLARLRRSREEIVEEHGQELYDLAQASLQWTAYQFLGKLKPTMYILKRGV